MHRIGAIFYGLWGVLHLLAALDSLNATLAMDAGIVQGRLFQLTWYLAFFALVAILVAAFGNWRNSRSAYWLNLIAISAADIPFLLFLLLPGYVPLWPGLLGPILWGLAVLFSTIGRFSGRVPTTP